MIERREKGERFSPERVVEHVLIRETVEVKPTDERICGLHVTSTELFDRMITTGHLVERSSERYYLNNELSVTPTQKILPKLSNIELSRGLRSILFESTPQEVRDESVLSYDAKTHHFMTKLGLPLDNNELFSKVYAYLSSRAPEERELSELAFGSTERADRVELNSAADLMPYIPSDRWKDVSSIAEQSHERHGLLLGIDAKADFAVKGPSYPQSYRDLPEDNIYKVYPESFGPTQVDVAFTPKGMPYTAIVSVEPLGPHERRFLNDLRARKKK